MPTAIPIERSSQATLIATSVVAILLATTFVGLRLYSKKTGLGVDRSDYFIVVALVWNNALNICCILMVTYGGFGFHSSELLERFGLETTEYFFKGLIAFTLLWNGTVCFSKLSVLLMYVAIIPTLSMRRWAKLVGTLIVIWNITDVIVSFLICRPLAKNWDHMIPGTCGSQTAFYFAMATINLITDAVIIILPMPYLFKLRMAMNMKLTATGLLSIGIVTWVLSIYRLTLLPKLNAEDMTYSDVLPTVLLGLEPAVAITLACVPLMRSLFGASRAKTAESSYEYGRNRSMLYTKKGSRTPRLDATETFSELFDRHDASSQIQLQPMKDKISEPSITRSSQSYSGPADEAGQRITVKKSWEVGRD